MADIFNLTDTWNNGSTDFAGVKMNVTNTASGSGSRVFDYQVGSVSLFSMKADGQLQGKQSGTLRIFSGPTVLCGDYLAAGQIFAIGNVGAGAYQAVFELASQNKIIYGSNVLCGWASLNSDTETNLRTNLDTALYRNAAGVVEINNGTAGTYRDLIARNVRTNATTVASLVAASTAGAGARAFVTDSSVTTFGSTVSGGGANSVPVYSDGTNWKVG